MGSQLPVWSQIMCNTLENQRGAGLWTRVIFVCGDARRRRRRGRLPVSEAGLYFSREHKCCHGRSGWDPLFLNYCFVPLLGSSRTLNQAMRLRQRLCRNCTAQRSQRNTARSASMSRWVHFSYGNECLFRQQISCHINNIWGEIMF